MITVLCFGNEYVHGDTLAKEIADEIEIEGVNFIKCDNVNEVLSHKGELYILDVAKGINEIKIFDDIDKLSVKNIMSLHDFDLGYFLKLMKETGEINKINIIAIPVGFDKKVTIEKIKSFFKK